MILLYGIEIILGHLAHVFVLFCLGNYDNKGEVTMSSIYANKVIIHNHTKKYLKLNSKSKAIVTKINQ